MRHIDAGGWQARRTPGVRPNPADLTACEAEKIGGPFQKSYVSGSDLSRKNYASAKKVQVKSLSGF